MRGHAPAWNLRLCLCVEERHRGLHQINRWQTGYLRAIPPLAQICGAVDFVRQRRQFGKRIGDFQMIQANIADMATDIEAARMLVYKAAWMKEQLLPTTRATSTAKLFATEIACQAAADAVLLVNGRLFFHRARTAAWALRKNT